MISMLNYLTGKVNSMYGQMGKYEKESNGNARGEINNISEIRIFSMSFSADW